jgi:hypothetical protein
MHRYISIAALTMITLVPFGVSSPTDGTYSDRNKIDSEPWRTTRTFVGGERACVVVFGDRGEEDVVSKVHIKVFDAARQLVVEDAGNSNLAGDFGGVAWYPPRTAEYRIEVHSAKANKVWIAIK